jgi:hypothetical protein
MEETLRHLYLDLIKRCILELVYEDKPMVRWDAPGVQEFDIIRSSGRF